MKRPSFPLIVASLLIVAGAVLLVATALLGWLMAAVVLPSYLADWLFWSALPAGALPVVLVLDLAGPGAGFGLEPVLRRLLWLMPVAAVLMIPVLLWPGSLFGWASGHGFSTPFGRSWMGHTAVVIRSIVYFAVWMVLALLFVRPPSLDAVEGRRGLAAAGLFVYLVTATLASVDWAMTTEPDWFSAEYGLLFIGTQVAIAISVALLLAGSAWRRATSEAAGSFLLLAVAVWLFLQFMQFLVIWSADKPSDISWYLDRSDAGSRLVAGVIVLIAAVPLALLLAPRGQRHPAAIPALAVLVLCGQALGMLWLITPSIRHSFTVSGMDLLSFAGIGGVMLGLCLLTGVSTVPAEAVSHHG
jgi:hypothetical protein